MSWMITQGQENQLITTANMENLLYGIIIGFALGMALIYFWSDGEMI